MSNEFEFFQPVAVSNAIHAYSEMVEEIIASLGHDDLLAPYLDEYRVRQVRDGDMGIEVDLHLAAGAHQRIVLPFTADRTAMRECVDEVRSRLADVLANLDDALDLCAAVETDVRSRVRRLARTGVRGRVLDVRLSPIDLTSPYGMGRIEIVVEGEACHMLRPFRDTWHVRSVSNVADEVAKFRDGQRARSAVRRSALSLDAVGFVDPLALVALDALPDGREGALRTIASKLEESWYLDRPDGTRAHVGLVWYDGVVRGVADLGGGVALSGQHVLLRGAKVAEATVGRAASDIVANAAVAGLTISSVFHARAGHATVELASSPLPFAADGTVLSAA